MKILVIADHDNIVLKGETLKTVDAALKIGGDIHVLVAGYHNAKVAEAAARMSHVSKVFIANHPAYAHQLAENISLLVSELGDCYSHILTANTSTGKDFLPRVAAHLNVAQISEITDVISPDTFTRAVFAGNAIETIRCAERIKVITVRVSAFDNVSTDGNAPIEMVTACPCENTSICIEKFVNTGDHPDLTHARVIISGGRGMKNRENFRLFDGISSTLNAAIGASRAAVDSGYANGSMQVGQTGKIVSPDLYIAVGISGALQHLAGIRDAKIIVAINNDPDAPIFKMADYGLCADLFDAIPELERKL